MADRTLSDEEFSNNVPTAVRATADGPVFITEQGRPTFVLLKIEDYYHLTGLTDATIFSSDYLFDPK